PEWMEKVTEPPQPGQRCTRETRKDYPIVHCRGPRAPVWLKTDKGWVVIRRNLDVTKPAARAGQLLLVIAFCVLIISAGVAVLITRPLTTTTEAMGRIAAGALSHRLPVTGGKELSEAARMCNAMSDR